ncbi:glycosyltransferase family 4 protein [Chroococcidiopsis thermalis]|uniref:Glycosyl transferase group 1 n=1 Tax=Chroococcidiopsis thermalis (strain PCC 7203) TaxID=251229 RepID=K9TUW7_CHRTP|nr:glycosyltransferase family 1 protein [Chroococcidiopsis thermalis]AFY86340.1 glycosyl transferase group 1 [Chroococcidiopsis thermalis PCC 7203]
MRVAIARTMAEFSIDVHTNGLISGLKAVRPDWEIIELAPRSFDRNNSSWLLRVQKYYERFWRYPRRVKQQTADIFHIIEPCDAHLVYWLKQTGQPAIVTCHDLINFFYRDNLKGSVQLPLVSRNAWIYAVKGMKYADRIIAVSSATAKDTTQILNIEPARISVIPNAVEAIFRPLSKVEVESFRARQGIDKETFCLLNVGVNHPRKNISNILQAVAFLVQKGLPIQFWKVGSDFNTEQKEFIQSHNLTKWIKYFGKPDKSTLIQLYNAANVLIAPSLHEGFGITILEAMACGTPVITSNASAMPEVVGDAGILVNPNNPMEIADAVICLQKDPTYYQDLVNKSLHRVKSFTWERTAEQVAKVYEELLSTRASSDRIVSSNYLKITTGRK